MDVHFLTWAITIAGIIGLLFFDFFSHVRTPHEPTIRESAIWSCVYIGIAILFGVGVGVFSNWTFGGEYFAGYITEKHTLYLYNRQPTLIIIQRYNYLQ